MDEQISKKKMSTTRCPSTSLGNFMNKNKEQLQLDREHEDEQEYENDHECEDEHEYENDHECEDEHEEADGDINHQNEQGGETVINMSNRGNIKKKAWENKMLGNRIEIIFNEYGLPIRPNQRTVVKFSNFLGTVERMLRCLNTPPRNERPNEPIQAMVPEAHEKPQLVFSYASSLDDEDAMPNITFKISAVLPPTAEEEPPTSMYLCLFVVVFTLLDFGSLIIQD
ncbi:hypothetical protein Lal_00031410 [Lupinus albus]|nr:hypothetical protein Lal_00031410 [Lupinus albus]